MDMNLSNLSMPSTEIQSTIDQEPDSVVRSEYNSNMIAAQQQIHQKIEVLNSKLKKFESKENMLDTIIAETHVELSNLKENEFTKRGQKQSILIKQLEALSVLHDTIMKYEDMVQKYHKVIMDIQNNKLNAFLKLENLKKEEEKSDDSLSEVLMHLQEVLGAGGKNPNSLNTNATLIAEIETELQDSNYK